MLDKFESFDRFKQRVDEFLGAFLAEKTYCNVYGLLKLVFTSSHGQSSIERGFSINKEHLVENLQEGSLIALRIINDHMFANNLTPININISKEMMTNVKFARQRYMAALGERKKLQIVDLKSRKRKQLAEEIEVISKKKKELISSIEKDDKQSDKLALQAEMGNDFSILHMSTSLKELVKKNREELNVLTKEEEKLKEKCLA